MTRKNRLLRGWLLGLKVLAALSVAETAAAAPVLRIQPAVTNVSVGDGFTLDVEITDADDLFAFDVEVSFDPTIVQALQLLPGAFLGVTEGVDVDAFSAFIDNGFGESSGAQSRLLLPGVSGTGVLFSIQFLALSVGSTNVDFDVSCDLADPLCTGLRNSLDEPTGFETAFGVVHVRERFPVVPEPALLWLIGGGLLLALRRRTP